MKLTLEEACEEIAVHECDEMNLACKEAGLPGNHPAGWWGVSTSLSSVIAYFVSERAAFEYRLFLINQLLNSPHDYDKDEFLAALVYDVPISKPLMELPNHGDWAQPSVEHRISNGKKTVEPTEWGGSPDPLDPDNYWIDDQTGERIDAKTGERSPKRNDDEFLGYHKFRGEDGGEYGSFEVFYNNASVITDGQTPVCDDGFYWHSCFPDCTPDGDPNGPFPTAEGAFLDAMGD